MWHTTGRSQRLHGHVLSGEAIRQARADRQSSQRQNGSLDLQIALQPGLARC
jgi:hypothetical protein